MGIQVELKLAEGSSAEEIKRPAHGNGLGAEGAWEDFLLTGPGWHEGPRGHHHFRIPRNVSSLCWLLQPSSVLLGPSWPLQHFWQDSQSSIVD